MRRSLLVLGASLAFVIALYGCNQKGGGGVPGGSTAAAVTSAAPATPAPQRQVVPVQTAFPPPLPLTLGVVGMTPGDHERNVPLGTPLQLRFSEPVDGAAVAAAVSVSNGDGVLLGQWTAGPDLRLHTFQPVALQPARHYMVVIDALTAQTGNTLQRPFRAAFATEDALRSPLLAGAAASDITPPVGVPLGGYGSDERRNAIFQFLPGADLDPTNYHVLFKPSVGKRDPLRVKFLVLDDGVRRVGIGSVDAIGCSNQLLVDVAPRIAAAAGIEPRDLFLHGTHTHHGPGDIAHDRVYWHIAMDHFDARVYDPIADAIVRAAADAAAALRPAALGATTVIEDRIGRNRRGHPGRYGRDLTIVRVIDDRGDALATLFNLPVHPSAMPIADLRYSADLAGEAERLIEQTVGGVGIFVNGCEGDVKANTPGGRSEAGMVGLGQTLGQRVLGELPNIPTTRHVPLDTISYVEDMGPPFTLLNCTAASAASDDVCRFFMQVGYQPYVAVPVGNLHSRRFRYSGLRLGDELVVATVPGEAITALGQRIRAALSAAGAPRVAIFGLTNGHMAYVTDATEYDEGGYEANSTLFGRDTGDRVARFAEFMGTRLIR